MVSKAQDSLNQAVLRLGDIVANLNITLNQHLKDHQNLVEKVNNLEKRVRVGSA